jgi:hypothetical protein
MSQIQSFSKDNCVLLAVLCGKRAEKRAPVARSGPEGKRLRPSYPFPELSSAGRLEVSWWCSAWPMAFVLFFHLNERAFESRCTHCSTQHLSSSSRRSGWCSPTSCISKGSSRRMRRRLVRLCGVTTMCLIRRRLALSSPHHSPP